MSPSTDRVRRGLLAGAGASLLSAFAVRPALAQAVLLAQSSFAEDNTGDNVYKPRRGQSGKDVIWIPTPNALVDRMLQLAGVTTSDYLIDLGSGDGKIVLAAAQRGTRARGIEYNADMVALSQRRAEAAGLSQLASFEKADIFESDFSKATVITMYLLPHLNMRLRPLLMQLKPGTRLVSHEFRMGNWDPDESSRIGYANAHLWLVPANAGGDWEISYPQRAGPASAKLTLLQTFQKLSGRAAFEKFDTGLRDARVQGEHARFGFTDTDGLLRRFDGRIAEDRMEGSVSSPDGSTAPFSGKRVGKAPPIGGSGPGNESENWQIGIDG